MKTIAYFPEADEELKNALNASRDPTRLRQAVQDALQDIASGRVTYAPVGRGSCRQCGHDATIPVLDHLYRDRD